MQLNQLPTLPANWSIPPNLWVVDASNNTIAGGPPPFPDLPTGLRILSLDGNLLTGAIPQGWGAPADGPEPCPGYICTAREIHLHNNNLSGECGHSAVGCARLRCMPADFMAAVGRLD